MNGFERHKEAFISKSNPDIHLSASTFALATNAMDVFVAEKLFGKRGAFGAAPCGASLSKMQQSMFFITA